jgi:hypothetical protein
MLPQQVSSSSIKWAGEEDTSVQKLSASERVHVNLVARIVSIQGLAVCLMLVGLGFLAWLSIRISAMRIYQVDECTEVFVAKVLTLGRERISGLEDIGLFQVFLSWVVASGQRAMELFVSARFLMLEIFWLNIVLMAVATGEKLFSLRGQIALIGAATLAPMWDYGMEIRHDNPFLTGMLLIWCAVRVRPSGPQSYFVGGALVVLMQFIAFKAFVYSVPVSVAILLFPPPGHKAPRWKLWVGWLTGAIAAFVAVRIWYGALGLWAAYKSGFGLISAASTGNIRFGAGVALNRLPGQTPLLLAITTAAIIGVITEVWRRRRRAITWEGNLPEAMLFFVALGALLINPTPFPYNLLHLVPYAYIFGFRYCAALWKELSAKQLLGPALGGVLAFTHFVPFGIATYRHLEWTNSRQEGLMRLAEDLTDPVKDPVYDATGMVPTRPIVHYRSFIHSFTIKALNEGPGPRFREMLAANPAAVLMPNYRTDALLPEDHDYMREHYVSMADDFWVLGKVLPNGGGRFEIIHPGRYRISNLSGSDLPGTYPEGVKSIMTPQEEGKLSGNLDGFELKEQTVELAAGVHRIETSPDTQVAVVWVGPRLDRIHRLRQSDHRMLFVNWY